MLGAFDYQYGQQGFVPRDPLSAAKPLRDPLRADPPTAAAAMADAAVQEVIARKGIGFAPGYRKARAARQAGVDPDLIRVLGPEAAQQVENLLSGAGGKTSAVAASAAAKGGKAVKGAGAGLRTLSSLAGRIPTGPLVGGSALLAGVPALMQGDVLGAAGSSGGALVGGLLGAPLGALGVAGGSFVGSMIGGGIVGGTKAALEKTPQAVSIPTPFGDLPLNASAQQLKYLQQLGELGETQYRNALGTRTSALIDLNKQIDDQDYLNRQRDFPLVQAEQNADLARSQALINTQNNAYMQQMVLGTAGNLMLDAQRERGALMRQAIATNPYVTALAAPSVSIG
jgi:hypothetical protein